MKRIWQCWRILVTVGLLLEITGCATHQPASPSSGGSTAVASTVTSGPILGYLWDKAADALRPIIGLPGASYLGQPVLTSGGYTSGTACAQKNFALLTGSKGDISIASLPAGVGVQLAPELSAAQKIVISPACASALVYAAGSAQVLLIQGLPGSPTVKTIDLGGSRQIVSAAVADTGSVLLASLQPSNSVTIDAIRSDGTLVPSLTALSAFGGMAFLPNADSAIFADAARNTVWLQNKLDAGVTPAQLAAGADGVAQPMAVAVSADAKWAVVLNSGSSILKLDLSKKLGPQKISCACSASELTPLAGNLTFRLSEAGAGPVWAFDGDAAEPRVVFIPGMQHASLTGAVK